MTRYEDSFVKTLPFQVGRTIISDGSDLLTGRSGYSRLGSVGAKDVGDLIEGVLGLWHEAGRLRNDRNVGGGVVQLVVRGLVKHLRAALTSKTFLAPLEADGWIGAAIYLVKNALHAVKLAALGQTAQVSGTIFGVIRNNFLSLEGIVRFVIRLAGFILVKNPLVQGLSILLSFVETWIASFLLPIRELLTVVFRLVARIGRLAAALTGNNGRNGPGYPNRQEYKVKAPSPAAVGVYSL